MARFEFRLQTLLTLREGEREQRRAEWAAAIARERRIAERLASLESQLARHREWIRAGTSPGAIAVEQLQSAGRYAAALRGQLADTAAEHEAAAAEVERRGETVDAAVREVRALEKLRERQLDEFQRRQARIIGKRSA